MFVMSEPGSPTDRCFTFNTGAVAHQDRPGGRGEGIQLFQGFWRCFFQRNFAQLHMVCSCVQMDQQEEPVSIGGSRAGEKMRKGCELCQICVLKLCIIQVLYMPCCSAIVEPAARISWKLAPRYPSDKGETLNKSETF